MHTILDADYVCHLGFVRDGAPVVLPTLDARVGERLYAHGSAGPECYAAPARTTVSRWGRGARRCTQRHPREPRPSTLDGVPPVTRTYGTLLPADDFYPPISLPEYLRAR
ncbi:pyridoxamine 5'-phosphate oxidase family protein [Streptomyces sp. AS58]|uniref:pyridoxamine 5'-phosphate oxidase family protein n=1 Tax=Streptomyces sp. AS58 TaxID=1519489 RepID=UPI001F449E95|nr:pyridoxamine 5'-phosphate oxidase family protein [Streptomyces sp. AS58]